MFALLLGCAGKDMKLANRGSEALVMNDYQNAEKYLKDPASVKADEPAVAQETKLKESIDPLKEPDPTSEIEKMILESVSSHPATKEVKKSEEATVTLSPEPQKTELPKKVYSIQVASYKNLDGAKKRITELVESGYDAYYKETFIKGKGTWQRIFVDKFKSKEEALEQARAMKDQKVISDYMIKIIE